MTAAAGRHNSVPIFGGLPSSSSSSRSLLFPRVSLFSTLFDAADRSAVRAVAAAVGAADYSPKMFSGERAATKPRGGAAERERAVRKGTRLIKPKCVGGWQRQRGLSQKKFITVSADSQIGKSARRFQAIEPLVAVALRTSGELRQLSPRCFR